MTQRLAKGDWYYLYLSNGNGRSLAIVEYLCRPVRVQALNEAKEGKYRDGQPPNFTA